MELLLLALSLLAPAIGGEVGRAIEGAVVDATGARIVGVAVEAKTAGDELMAETRTDVNGVFRIRLPGERDASGGLVISFRKPGFEVFRLRVGAGENPDLSAVTLQVDGQSDELTVSAESAGVESTASTPQQVNVITSAKLVSQGYWNLSAAATSEPGVSVQATSPTLGGIYIRGMSGDDVPVFLDGVRMSTSAARGGINTFFNLNEAANLQSMELLRGPNSAQYGSDSLGGVIALQSRTPELSSAGDRLHTSWGGSYDSATHGAGTDLSVSHRHGDLGWIGSLSGRRVNTLRTGGGIDSHSALTRFLGLPSSTLYERLPDTAFTQYGGMLHGQWNPSGLSQTVFHYQRSQQDGGKRFDQLLGGDGNLIADLKNLMGDLAYLRYQAFPRRWFNYVSATGSFLSQREQRRNQGGQGDAEAAIRSEFERATVWGAALQLASNRSQAFQFVLGADSYLENLKSRGLSLDPQTEAETRIRARIPDRARYTHGGVFSQASSSLWSDRVRIAGAVRWHRAAYQVRGEDAPVVNGSPLYTSDSLAVQQISGRVGAVVNLAGGLSFRTYYARGFRAPTVTNLGTLGLTGNGYEVGFSEIAALGGEVGSTAGEDAISTGIPVRGLRPETSDNIDLGISWQNAQIRLDFTGFAIHRRNVIAKRSLILPDGSEGVLLGDQAVSMQHPSGIVFVPLVPNPVLVRTNAGEARFRGLEQRLSLRLGRTLTLSEQASFVRAEDSLTGLPPDINSGVPAPAASISLRYHPGGERFWIEPAMEGSLRQSRISSVGLADRRVGATRSLSSIARYFANGAVAQGLVEAGADGVLGTADDLLIPTGETLPEVQFRVLGTRSSAPLFDAIPGYLLLHLRAGFRIGESHTVAAGVENITDRNYRGLAWGVDGRGRSLVVQWRSEF